jgi:hypothetical protein
MLVNPNEKSRIKRESDESKDKKKKRCQRSLKTPLIDNQAVHGQQLKMRGQRGSLTLWTHK